MQNKTEYERIEQLLTSEPVGEISKELKGIIERFPKGETSCNLIDTLLFCMLYRREKLLLKTNGNQISRWLTNAMEELSDIINDMNKPLEINDGTDRLVVLVTHSCQLRCEYCRVRKFNAEMNWETMTKSIDFLFTSNKKDLQLQFFGGEPLLKFDLIKKAVKYAETLAIKLNKSIKFILTTNGIVLTKDKIPFLKEHGFLIEFSLDGDIETQLKTRKSASGKDYYSMAEENLNALNNAGIPYYTISVVTPSTVSKLYDNFRYLAGKCHKRIQINYSLGQYWDSDHIKILIDQLNMITGFVENNPNKGVELINFQKTRREPVVLNAELTVDCDGTIFLESGICLEEDFIEMRNKFKVANVSTAEEMGKYSTSQFNNFQRLVDAYSEQLPDFRRIIINNIELGNFMKKYSKNRSLLRGGMIS